MNRLRTILAQRAVLTQALAQLHNMPLDSHWRAVPTGCATWSPIREIRPIQPTDGSTFNPPGYRAHAHPKFCSYCVHAPASTYRTHHRAPRFLTTEFLAMIKPSKKPKPYRMCSAIAETQVFRDR
jgi:hypothetical protein